MPEGELSIVSKHTVRPSPRHKSSPERIHLTPWDLRMISSHYIQKGILFHKPHHLLIPDLLTSFSRALNIFYPLAGRFVTTANHHHHHDDGGGDSLSISLDCTDEGADFIHASAPHLKVSDILTPHNYYIPTVVHSFFPLNGAFNHDGHSLLLLAAQVTELADGVFIACSLNHSVADGTTFWHFFNTWSSICRHTGGSSSAAEHPAPVFDRWFPDSCPPPLRLPFKSNRQFIKRVSLPPLPECAFDFSPESIKKLKARANEETGGGSRISSLQAVMAHAWRLVTRARGLGAEEETRYTVFVGYRARLSPPLPETYVGNAILGAPVRAAAGEVREKGLGWAARLLNQAVAEASEGKMKGIEEWVERWAERPGFLYLDEFREGDVMTGSSPRFDVYGNDFGWGRPVAVRSGAGAKVDGKMTVYPGPEEGSMTLEICLAADALSGLLQDRDFMEVVE